MVILGSFVYSQSSPKPETTARKDTAILTVAPVQSPFFSSTPSPSFPKTASSREVRKILGRLDPACLPTRPRNPQAPPTPRNGALTNPAYSRPLALVLRSSIRPVGRWGPQGQDHQPDCERPHPHEEYVSLSRPLHRFAALEPSLYFVSKSNRMSQQYR